MYATVPTGWKLKYFFFHLSFFWAGRSPARPGNRAWSAAARFCAALAAWHHPARTDLQQRWLPVYGITKMFGVTSGADPDDPGSDPLVRGTDPGSFYHQAKIVRQTLIPTVLWFLFVFLSLKNNVNVPSKSNKQKNFFLNWFFVGVLKVNDKNSRIRIQIRIH